VIPYGTNNLPSNGALPASPRFETNNYANIHFDSKGRLYISRDLSDSRGEVYQIDFENNWVRKYLGGGYATSDGSAPLDMAVVKSGYSFDEDVTWCGGSPVPIRERRFISYLRIQIPLAQCPTLLLYKKCPDDLRCACDRIDNRFVYLS
jgi:hypothetical protein